MKRNLLKSLLSLSFIVIAGCNQVNNLQTLPDQTYAQSLSTSTNLRASADWFDNLRPDLQQYYADAKGKTGADLFDALHKIISQNNHIISYMDSKSFMYATLDNIKVNNQTGVLDAYSEVFVPGSGTNGDSYKEQGDDNKDGTANDFINCEHTWPQSFFGKSLPMVGDLHHLQSTLSVPNRMRSDFPFGVATGNVSYITSGGSKLSVVSGNGIPIPLNTLKKTLLATPEKNDIQSNDVKGIFEPGDKQKGRTARAPV